MGEMHKFGKRYYKMLPGVPWSGIYTQAGTIIQYFNMIFKGSKLSV